MTPALRIKGVTRLFGGARVLDGLDLEVPRGGCVGLSGANGSGRTTLLQIAAALLAPTSGSVEVVGIDAVRSPLEARTHAMFVGGYLPAGTGLSSREYLEFVAKARATHSRPLLTVTPAAALERGGLRGEASVDRLSTGLGKRLALAAALLASPPVLLLDDPLASLDAPARAGYRAWIAESRHAGMTVLAALNDDADGAAMCDVVFSIERGRIAVGATGSSRPASNRPLAQAAGGR